MNDVLDADQGFVDNDAAPLLPRRPRYLDALDVMAALALAEIRQMTDAAYRAHGFDQAFINRSRGQRARRAAESKGATMADTPPDITLYPVDSGQIAALGYDKATRTLAIRFKAGKGQEGPLYHYPDTEHSTYLKLRADKSVSSYFQTHIKPRNNHVRIDAPKKGSK